MSLRREARRPKTPDISVTWRPPNDAQIEAERMAWRQVAILQREKERFVELAKESLASAPERAALWTPPARERQQAWPPPVVDRHPSDPPPPIEGLACLPVGWTLGVDPNASETWTIPLWKPGHSACNMLVTGIPGSGKTRFLYKFISEVAPWCHGDEPLVELWGLDPKQVCLNIAAPLFTHLWTPRHEPEDQFGVGAAELLEAAVSRMRKRLNFMQDHGLTEHTPTAEERLIVIVLDELAELAGNRTPKPIRLRIDAALAALARWGRAPGLPVLLATQEPSKDLMPWRDAIARAGCIGYQLASNEQVTMAMGPGAREKGALCDELVEPGSAFVWWRGNTRFPRRVMTGFVENDELKRIAHLYAAPGRAPA